MAAPIRIGTLAGPEASDLAAALAARGLIACTLGSGDERWLEVRELHETTDRLVADVSAAVETWLAEHDRAPLELRVGGRPATVSGQHGDLGDALRRRIPSAPREPEPRAEQ